MFGNTHKRENGLRVLLLFSSARSQNQQYGEHPSLDQNQCPHLHHGAHYPGHLVSTSYSVSLFDCRFYCTQEIADELDQND